MMMLVRIGTIGSTQGVNVSSSPAPNSDRITSQRLPDMSAVATRSCSGSSMGAAPGNPGASRAPPAMPSRAWRLEGPVTPPVPAEPWRPVAPAPGPVPAPVSARAAGSSSETVLVIGG